MRYFQTIFLEDAELFISGLEQKTIKKILYNIDLAEQSNDPKLFKKLNDEIWEFRTRYNGKQIRLLAFWDKSDKSQTLVIACNGFIKKTDKIPNNEMEKATKLKLNYFDNNSQ